MNAFTDNILIMKNLLLESNLKKKKIINKLIM